MGITTSHKLLTTSWTVDVAALETAIEGFKTDRLLADGCQVAFFEIASDDQLHVNVKHRHLTMPVRGWAGPARLPDGIVHNRRFAGTARSGIIQHIRDMVFAIEKPSTAAARADA
jgi:hypothetical protein